jgi:hypothetical protein
MGLDELAKIKAQGWKYTQDGWLSPENIKAAGYVEIDGVLLPPGQEYINEIKTQTKEAGEKYWYYSKQYLDWKKRKRIREYGNHYDHLIDKYLNSN